ncbi:SPOR domain-containing protein [uncultured Pseudoteredinibacter sp.]|uniref:SPOR domain-containing protein n=1 Tax=uncultured Pseudoteredinibacter sp. TaxID=1641701 RepID=UPI00261E872F|nr:SPOR domain-containing protein [uncultured Pseudoteredinibacter sp.]
MDDGLKQRLVGAVVLSAVAVLFVPVLFDQHDKHKVDTVSQIPAMPDVEPVNYQSPSKVEGIDPAPKPEQMFIPEGGSEQLIDDTASVIASSGAEEAPFVTKPKQLRSSEPAAKNSQSPKSQNLAASQIDKAAKASSQKPAVQPTSSNDILNADGTPNAWVLQLISSSSEAKAKGIVKQLQDKDYRAYYRSAKTPKGLIYRVFVGPKISRRKAEQLKRELDKLLKVDALILRFQP